MKYIFLACSLLFFSHAFGQKLRIENRDGQAVIVTRDTSSTGETIEKAEWKADPKIVLEKQLADVNQYLIWLDGKITRLQAEQKQKMQERADIEKAIIDLDRGIEQPSEVKKAGPSEKKTPSGPTKPAKKNKPKKG